MRVVALHHIAPQADAASHIQHAAHRHAQGQRLSAAVGGVVIAVVAAVVAAVALAIRLGRATVSQNLGDGGGWQGERAGLRW